MRTPTTWSVILRLSHLAVITLALTGCMREIADYALLQSLSNSSQLTTALTQLRNGDTNACIQTLERMLNEEIITLAAKAEEKPKVLLSEGSKTISRVLAHRQAQPFTSTDQNYATGVSNSVYELQRLLRTQGR